MHSIDSWQSVQGEKGRRKHAGKEKGGRREGQEVRKDESVGGEVLSWYEMKRRGELHSRQTLGYVGVET